MNKRTLSVLAFTAALGFSGAANALLFDRGNGLIYDDVLDITWLADANLFKTQYDADNTVVNQIISAVPTITDSTGTHNVVAGDFFTGGGGMTWWGAMAWAEWLNFGGYDDWRLPTTLQPDSSCEYQSGGVSYGDNCTGSEMGHMFYNNLGATVGSSILNGSNTANLSLFSGIQNFVYWSGTEYAPGTYSAWFFNADFGNQFALNKDIENFAWAVRSGDVAAVDPSIPEPGSLTLVGLGLVGLGWVRRRRG
ncbi:MAG: DUF1566 domain-containing protein [Candidatus Competibacteraceae bacterium]|nr:DUF1566 domain-containing protein [Candidatus Competibacteraceae bacterium]MCP5125422.1 DUF1566 domain-containing protein [Gammaproteobacteria bacterium]HRX69609.1 DUF1566 domain-containing protein [Candidatus Competibacteraceae bacterium]